jgi:hypothetical protein
MPFKKKPPAKSATKRGPMTAEDHRKLAATHSAKSSLQHAKAQLLEAQDPKQKKRDTLIGRY